MVTHVSFGSLNTGNSLLPIEIMLSLSLKIYNHNKTNLFLQLLFINSSGMRSQMLHFSLFVCIFLPPLTSPLQL